MGDARNEAASDYQTETFKGHLIAVERDNSSVGEGDWYILVQSPSGEYAYDGWWRDSANKTAAEAIEEAKRGALLIGATHEH